jgi:hypothetical protein
MKKTLVLLFLICTAVLYEVSATAAVSDLTKGYGGMQVWVCRSGEKVASISYQSLAGISDRASGANRNALPDHSILLSDDSWALNLLPGSNAIAIERAIKKSPFTPNFRKFNGTVPTEGCACETLAMHSSNGQLLVNNMLFRLVSDQDKGTFLSDLEKYNEGESFTADETVAQCGQYAY